MWLLSQMVISSVWMLKCTEMCMICSNWWCRKHVREYLPIVWTEEPNFVGYLKSANIYIVRFLCEFETVKAKMYILVYWRFVNFGGRDPLCYFLSLLSFLLSVMTVCFKTYNFKNFKNRLTVETAIKRVTFY